MLHVNVVACIITIGGIISLVGMLSLCAAIHVVALEYRSDFINITNADYIFDANTTRNEFAISSGKKCSILPYPLLYVRNQPNYMVRSMLESGMKVALIEHNLLCYLLVPYF